MAGDTPDKDASVVVKCGTCGKKYPMVDSERVKGTFYCSGDCFLRSLGRPFDE